MNAQQRFNNGVMQLIADDPEVFTREFLLEFIFERQCAPETNINFWGLDCIRNLAQNTAEAGLGL
jgi:hypothetical protein